MANEKHKTVLEIGVDDRDLRRFGSTLRRTFDTEPVDRYQRALEKLVERMSQAEGAGPGGSGRGRDASGRSTRGSGGARGGRRGGGGGQDESEDSDSRQRRKQSDYLTRAGQAGGAVARGQGLTATALGAIPYVGPALAGALATVERLTNIAVSASQARVGAMGVTGMRSMGGLGGFGISDIEAPSVFAQLAQQSSLRGDELGALVPDALRYQKNTGIDIAGLGGGLGTANAGPFGAGDILSTAEEIISAGIDTGIRAAKLPQFFDTMSRNIEQMRSRGIMLDPAGLPNLAAAFAQTGGAALQGEAGVHAARTMSESVRSASKGNTMMDALAMQTALDTKNELTGRNYTVFEASAELERNPERFIPGMIAKMQMMGGSDEARAMALREYAPNLSLEAALNLAKGIGPTMGSGGDQARALLRGNEEALGGYGLAADEAAITNLDLGVGREVAPADFLRRKAEAGVAHIAAPMGASLAQGASDLITRYSKPASEGDWAGMASMAFEDLTGMMGSMLDGIVDAIKEAFTPESIEKLTGRVLPKSMDEAMDNLSNNTSQLLTSAIHALIQAINGLLEWLGLEKVSITPTSFTQPTVAMLPQGV